MTPRLLASQTVQRCQKCRSHRIAPVVQPDRTILYRCLDCGTVVTEPEEW